MIPKYPFLVTVQRSPGGTRPTQQQFSFESVAAATLAAEGHAKDKQARRVSLSMVIEEWSPSGPDAPLTRR